MPHYTAPKNIHIPTNRRMEHTIRYASGRKAGRVFGASCPSLSVYLCISALAAPNKREGVRFLVNDTTTTTYMLPRVGLPKIVMEYLSDILFPRTESSGTMYAIHNTTCTTGWCRIEMRLHTDTDTAHMCTYRHQRHHCYRHQRHHHTHTAHVCEHHVYDRVCVGVSVFV